MFGKLIINYILANKTHGKHRDPANSTQTNVTQTTKLEPMASTEILQIVCDTDQCDADNKAGICVTSQTLVKLF